MNRLENVVLAVAPRGLIHRLSLLKAGARNKLAARRFGPLARELFPDSTSELLVANDDAVVFRVGGPGGAKILKISSSVIATEQLRVETAALEELATLPGLDAWRYHVAQVEDQGTHSDGRWFTQSVVSGEPTSKLQVDADLLVAAAVEALGPLHRATEQQVTADDNVLDELVTGPLQRIQQWRPSVAANIAATNSELRQRLAGRALVVSRQHGDYAPSNVLWNREAGAVSGIVDWKFDQALLPPEIDYVHYALSVLMQRSRAEYGDTVQAVLDGATATHEASTVGLAVDAGPNQLDTRTAVILAWSQHISFGLHKAHDLRENPIWLVNNIDAVARALN